MLKKIFIYIFLLCKKNNLGDLDFLKKIHEIDYYKFVIDIYEEILQYL